MSKSLKSSNIELESFIVKTTLKVCFWGIFLLFLWRILGVLGWYVGSGKMAHDLSTQIDALLQQVPVLGTALKWLAEHRNVGV